MEIDEFQDYLFDMYEKLTSGKQKERLDGLSQLRQFITNRDNAKELNDKDYVKMFEAIFHATNEEKKSTKNKTITAAVTNRIAICGSVLRAAVEAGVKYIRGRSITCIFDNVMNILGQSKKEFTEPLSLDYVKSLRIILEYPPHREHISIEDWKEYMEFCCFFVSTEFAGNEDDSQESFLQGSRAGTSSLSRSHSSLSNSRRTIVNSSHTRLRSDTEELIVCIQMLLTTPNAAILGTIPTGLEAPSGEELNPIFVGDALLAFLSSYGTITRAHLPALTAMSLVFQWLSPNNIRITRQLSFRILPIIRRMWPSKTTNIKEQLIIILIYILPHLKYALRGKNSANLREEVDLLLQVLLDDFKVRLERDCLPLEEVRLPLTLNCNAIEEYPLQLPNMLLRKGTNLKMESYWATPRIISMLINILDAGTSTVDNMQNAENHPSGKRRRVSLYFGEVIRDLHPISAASKLAAVQLVPFLLNDRMITEEEVVELFTVLLQTCSDDDRAVASWAMLSIASLTISKCGQTEKCEPFLMQSWRIALRNITSPATSRAACHLAHVLLSGGLIPFATVAEDVEVVLSQPDLSGPVSICDSSLAFWVTVLQKRSEVAVSSSVIPGERVLHWFVSRWRPIEYIERSAASQFCQTVESRDILDTILIACGKECLPKDMPTQAVCAEIGQATIRTARLRRLFDLLLLEDGVGDDSGKQASSREMNMFAYSAAVNEQLEKRLYDFLDRSVHDIHAKWTELCNKAQHISSDMLSYVATFIIVGSGVLSSFNTRNANEVIKLWGDFEELVADVGRYIQSKECKALHMEGFLKAFSGVLPSVESITHFQCKPQSIYYGLLGKLIEHVSKALIDREEAFKNLWTDDDGMEIDDGFDIPERRSSITKNLLSKRDEIQATFSSEAFSADMSTLISLFACAASKPHQGELAKEFSDYLQDIPIERAVLSNRTIRQFLTATESLGSAEAAALLEHFGEKVLQSYSFERCEPGILLCISVVNGLAPKWIPSTADEEIKSTGESVYEWLIKFALGKHIASPPARIAIASLLQHILDIRLEYGKNSDLNSARTNFVLLLEDDDVRVKFHMADSIPHFFDLIAVHLHQAVYTDVHKHLPKEVTSIEGMSIRLYALSRITSESLFIRKSVVYHMFETGQFDRMLPYAKRSMTTIAKSMGLEKRIQLFKLYSSQIIFTWLSGNGIRDFPYKIAGYREYKDFLADQSEEVIAQLLSTQRESELQGVAQTLDVPLKQLIDQAFVKIYAYGIATEATTKVAPEIPFGTRLKNIFGQDETNNAMVRDFARIMGVLFQIMEPDAANGTFDKVLSRHAELLHARKTMAQICGISLSTMSYRDSLKPSFNASAIMSTLLFICECSNMDPANIWQPGMFTYVARKLFDTMHPALGRMHSATVIRKLRLLVCFAGDTALQGYPLEMMVQGLRPYITDSFSAEDTIGVIQYLISNGKEHLSTRPAFTAGTILSMLTILKTFISEQSQESIQQSQLESSQSSAQSFRTWLEQSATDYQSPMLSSKQNELFQKIIGAARGFHSPGNADIFSNEGQLLKYLLEDESSEVKLLDDVSQKMAFKLVVRNFAKPKSFRQDILGQDEHSITMSQALFRICRKLNVSEGFLLWSGRVFGRAYAASGKIHKDWTQEFTSIPRQVQRNRLTAIDICSKAAIFEALLSLLVSDDKVQVGLAEATLVEIIPDAEPVNSLLPEHILKALTWDISPYAEQEDNSEPIPMLDAAKFDNLTVDAWIKRFAVSVARHFPSDSMGPQLVKVLESIPGLAEKLFPYIVHIALCDNPGEEVVEEDVRQVLSKAFANCIKECTETTVPHVSILIQTINYLRTQPTSTDEKNVVRTTRDEWLDIDFLQLSIAASTCKLYKTALLFAEIHSSRKDSDRLEIPTSLLIDIYTNIDEPDSFYGVSQQPSLQSALSKFEYEGEIWKTFSFRGANMESTMRSTAGVQYEDGLGLINAFNGLGMTGLSHIVQQNPLITSSSCADQEKIYQSGWKLEKWDLPCPDTVKSESAMIYRALQTVNTSSDTQDLSAHFDRSFLDAIKGMTSGKHTSQSLSNKMRTLSILTEIEEILVSKSPREFEEVITRQTNREAWMQTESFDKVEKLISARRSAYSSLVKHDHLRSAAKINRKVAIWLEVKSLISACKMAQAHNALQHSLSAATQLQALKHKAAEVDLRIGDTTTMQVAHVLWEQGESASAIGLVQQLIDQRECSRNRPNSGQDFEISKSMILAQAGVWISEARSLKPDRIIADYLEKAVMSLERGTDRAQLTHVYHEFAAYCDAQLNNPSNKEDYVRVKKLRDAKAAELQGILRISKDITDKREKKAIEKHQSKARKHFEIDNAEFERLDRDRQSFLKNSIANYLLSLKYGDKYESDAVRFCALWLEHCDNDAANTAAEKYLKDVPSRKFVSLMNQLSSKLSTSRDTFQMELYNLVGRICMDHPHHGLYQVLSLLRGNRDEPTSEQRAQQAHKLVSLLQSEKRSKNITNSIYQLTQVLIQVAATPVDKERRSNKMRLKDCRFPRSVQSYLEKEVSQWKVPPPTMTVDIRPDCDYSSLPTVLRFEDSVQIASGLSTPRIMKCLTSDGKGYKMLVKGGTDDLRQDAIMEQVFEQVSHLLKKSRATRQRGLKIRTYKVIPMTTSAGIIEFVPNTKPLHDYLLPAHAHYRPKDWKVNVCRKVIADAHLKSKEERIEAYRKVTTHFKPVMRYFFMHTFDGPDKWFETRLAYSRTTAAISILGYVLGLGDRHGHNILLDELTGEVVHIDLGVAFEQGRVLPIPEVVPFRLTRDVVDGMGITKTEGVFRRCCEYTLSLLRDEAHNITTILDVLRYDPLYSWTISPLRMQRMQAKDQEDEQNTGLENRTTGYSTEEGEESEATRSLLVVARKLSKTLSVSATVSELIREATDEKNLAMLFCGWASYV